MRKLDRSNLTRAAKTRFSNQKYPTAKIGKKELCHQVLAHTKPSFRLKSRLKITHETIQMAFLSDRNRRVSCQRRREESFGNMKVKHRIQDRHFLKIQDLVITSTKRKKTILKIGLFRKRPFMQLSTAAIPDQSIRK